MSAGLKACDTAGKKACATGLGWWYPKASDKVAGSICQTNAGCQPAKQQTTRLPVCVTAVAPIGNRPYRRLVVLVVGVEGILVNEVLLT
jgi:hypothetical protein